MMRLEGRVAVITGAGGWLGRGNALRLAEEGARVMVNDKNLKTASETADLIISRGGIAVVHGADVTRAEDVQEMIEEVVDEWGRRDILVNNAGEIRDALHTKMSDQDWDYVVDLSLKGSFTCARAAVPRMIERG